MLGLQERDNVMRKFMMITIAGALLSTVFIAGCAYGQNPQLKQSIVHKFKPEKPHVDIFAAYKVYNPDANAMAQIDKALTRARKRGTKVMVVMGANWCHDSKSFAARMDKPEFQTLLADNYEIVYVNAGTAQFSTPTARDIGVMLTIYQMI